MPREYRTTQSRLGMQHPLEYPVANLEYLISERFKDTAAAAKKLAAYATRAAGLTSAAASAVRSAMSSDAKQVYLQRWYGWNENQGPTPRCTGWATVVSWLHRRRREIAADGSVTITNRAGTPVTYPSLDALANAVYETARGFDQSQGWHYDEGATMWGSAMAARELGLCTGFRWGESIADGINAQLNGHAPCLGIDWTDGMEDPAIVHVGGERIAIIRDNGAVIGGHDICWTGTDIDDGFMRLNQTWDRKQYGVEGLARMPVRDGARRLASGGELLIFTDDEVRPTMARAA
jgi:hypothetical protein